jgi:glycine cleavage system H protein
VEDQVSVPEELEYTRSHEWVRTEDDTATIGITDYAQEELGDIVYVELPEQGDSFDAGDSFGSIESVKAVSDLYTPIGGEVVEVNEALNDSPEKINEDPYGDGWIVKLRVSEEGDLLSASDYEQLLEEEES